MTNIIDLMIGRQILLRRLEMQMSQAELADGLALSPSDLDLIEVGNRRVTNALLKQFAAALTVPLSYFFEWDAPDDQVSTDASKVMSEPAAASIHAFKPRS